jgi:hypothetical protein
MKNLSDNHIVFSDPNCLSKDILISYHTGSLSEKERHKVEKHIMDCELCSDALAGFALIPKQGSMTEISSRLNRLTEGNRSTKRFMIAASITAALFVTGYLYNNLNNSSGQKDLALNSTDKITSQEPREPLNKTATEVSTENEEKDHGAHKPSPAENYPPTIQDRNQSGRVASDLFKAEKNNTITLKSNSKSDTTSIESASEGMIAASSSSNASSADLADASMEENVSPKTEDEDLKREVHNKAEAESQTMAKKEMEKLQPQAKAPVDAETKTMVTNERARIRQENAAARSDSDNTRSQGMVTKSAIKSIPPKAMPSKSGNSTVTYFAGYKTVPFSSLYPSSPNENSSPEEGVPARFENSKMKSESYKKSKEDVHVIKTTTYDEVLENALEKYKAESYSKAIELFNLLLTHFPGDINALFYIGLCNYQQGQSDQAIANLTKVIDHKNKLLSEEAKWYVALSYIKKADTKEAKRFLNEIISENGFYKGQATVKLSQLK